MHIQKYCTMHFPLLGNEAIYKHDLILYFS